MSTAQVTEAPRPEVTVESSTSLAVPPESHPGTDIAVLRSIPSQFCVEDENSVNWVIRKIMSARAYGQSVREWAEAEVRRAEREETTLLFLFGRQVEAWAKTEIAKLKGKRKSINLPAGCIGFRTVTSRLIVDDEARVLAWAKHHLPDAVVITEKLAKSVINAHAEREGVIPDEGVHIEPAAEKFFIR